MEIGIIILMFLLGYIDSKSKRVSSQYDFLYAEQRKTAKRYCGLILLYLAFLVAFRDYNSMTYIDTKAYRDIFYVIQKHGPITARLYHLSHTEIGFNLFVYSLSMFKTPLPFNIVYSILVFGTVYKFIIKHSDDYLMSTLIFFLMFFIYTPNAVRQMLAGVILLVALDRYLDGKEILAILLVGVAVLFHRTAVVFFSILLFKHIKVPKKNSMYIYLMVYILAVSLVILEVSGKLQWRYAHYVRSHSGFYLQKFAYVIIDILVLYFLLKNKDDKKTNILIWVMTGALYFDFLSIRINLLTRIGSMFSLSSIAFLPTYIGKNKKSKEQLLTKAVVICAYLIYFLAKLELSELRNFFPWKFAF